MTTVTDIELRAVIRFFTLKGIKPKAIYAELKGVYGDDVCSISTVKKWNKRFFEGRTKLEDDTRSGRPQNIDLSRSVLDLLEEFPFMSCKAICTVLEIPKTSCLRILHDTLKMKKFNLRWVPYLLSEEQKQKRVDCCRELLNVIRYTKQGNLITGDESWFFYHIPAKSAWAQSRKDLPTLPQLDIGKKKSLISVFWSPEGLHSLVALPPDATYDSTFFCQSILPNIKTGLCTGRRRRTLRGIILHMDNARPP